MGTAPFSERAAREARLAAVLPIYAGRWVAVRREHVIEDALTFEDLAELVCLNDVDQIFEIEPVGPNGHLAENG